MKQFLLALLVILLVACQQAPVSEQIPGQEPAKEAPLDQQQEPFPGQPQEIPPDQLADETPAETPASDALQFLTIDIHRKSFEPPSATAGQGTKLVLTNRDTISHPVYIRFEDEVFLATKIIKPEASLTVILDRAGIYKLFESTYGLKGRIDVQKSLVIVPGKVD